MASLLIWQGEMISQNNLNRLWLFKFKILTLITVFLLFSAPDSSTEGIMLNGFKIIDPLIPAYDIYPGGPPRDGIPSIDSPKFLNVKDAKFMRPSDRVLGIKLNGVAKAYPIRILNWHEIVNDRFKEDPVVISYCPLCGTGVAFSSIVSGSAKSFGVSGLLYNSDVLLHDRETESLWSQILGKAVSGPLKGTPLKKIYLFHTTWGDWKKRHGDTLVLSTITGFRRNYDRDPYDGYEKSKKIMFPVSNKDSRYHEKELIIGIEVKGKHIAFPFTEMEKASKDIIKQKFNGQDIWVSYDHSNRSALVTDPKGNPLDSLLSYWFAWIAFFPDTEVYTVFSNPEMSLKQVCEYHPV